MQLNYLLQIIFKILAKLQIT